MVIKNDLIHFTNQVCQDIIFNLNIDPELEITENNINILILDLKLFTLYQGNQNDNGKVQIMEEEKCKKSLRDIIDYDSEILDE